MKLYTTFLPGTGSEEVKGFFMAADDDAAKVYLTTYWTEVARPKMISRMAKRSDDWARNRRAYYHKMNEALEGHPGYWPEEKISANIEEGLKNFAKRDMETIERLNKHFDTVTLSQVEGHDQEEMILVWGLDPSDDGYYDCIELEIDVAYVPGKLKDVL